MPDAAVPLSVGALTALINDRVTDIGPVTVCGELSRAEVYRSGHLYATLKDADAVLSVVMWRTTIARQGRLPREGDRVLVRGRLAVYAPRGQYQLVANRISPAGAGDLAARFEALKRRLEAEGLFAADRKRPLPFCPRVVGLATAPGSAALADMVDSLRTRFPAIGIVHAPCQVQGTEAAGSIASALARLDRHPAVEVIICGRGGGSLEDLWAFNEETVVRAIAACAIPVISAVGHETDTTLSDHVADLRAKTPTAAGELAVPLLSELIERLARGRYRLDQAVRSLYTAWRARLLHLAQHRALAGPGHQLAMRRQRLDELGQRLDEALDDLLHQRVLRLGHLVRTLNHLHPGLRCSGLHQQVGALQRRLVRAMADRARRAEDRLGALVGRLDALSPLGVIARGYSVVRTEEGEVVRRLDQAPPGTRIRARLEDGWLEAEARGGTPRRLAEARDIYEA
ncbi:MAG: exodeoxyribonuclease VII large subunit [Planctomycetota bacterium]